MIEKIYVICGNYDEFLEFAKRKLESPGSNHTISDLSNFVFVNYADKLLGLKDPHGYLYGTWMKNPEIRQILIKLASCYSGNPPESIKQAWKEYRNSEFGPLA